MRQAKVAGPLSHEMIPTFSLYPPRSGSGDGAARRRFEIRGIDLYVVAVTVIAASTVMLGGDGRPAPAWDCVVFLACLCAAAQLLQVGIEASTVSASVAVTFAAAISYTPGGFALVTLAGSLVHALWPRRRPVQKSVFNWATWLLAAAAASATYQLLRGQAPPVQLGADSLAVLGAGAAYFLTNTGLVTIAIHLSTGAPLRQTWTQNYRWLAINYGLLITIGYVMAIAAQGSPQGLLLVAALVVLPWASTQLYVSKARQAAREMTARLDDARRLNEALEHQALHDQLTGLPNRALLQHRLQQGIAAGQALALLVMDLDRFKDVNDTLGHHHGDLLLREIGARLRTAARGCDTVARLGGDEFALLLPGARIDEATRAVEVLHQRLQRPLVLDGYTLDVGASVGIALFPDHGTDVDTLSRRADVAMYVAKRRGIGSAVYSQEQDPNTPDRLELLAELRHALEDEEFRVHYQPIVDLTTGKLVEAEALVRWEHPQRGLISPAEFIPLAEEAGLIVQLGRWVLEQACRQARAWHATSPGVGLVMGVNLSARQFQQPGLAEDVARILRQTGLDPGCLKLEITEGVAMDDAELTVATLHRLKATGVRIAIDDFGTGYSSLSYLKRFPVDTLKVDKAFVDGVARSSEDAGIVRAIVAFAGTLGLSTTAEGIEDAEQLAALQELGCGRGQGYYFARPLPAEDMAALLAAGGALLRRSPIVPGRYARHNGPLPHGRIRPAA